MRDLARSNESCIMLYHDVAPVKLYILTLTQLTKKA